VLDSRLKSLIFPYKCEEIVNNVVKFVVILFLIVEASAGEKIYQENQEYERRLYHVYTFPYVILLPFLSASLYVSVPVSTSTVWLSLCLALIYLLTYSLALSIPI